MDVEEETKEVIDVDAIDDEEDKEEVEPDATPKFEVDIPLSKNDDEQKYPNK